MEFDPENAEKSANVELTDVQIQNKENKSSGEVIVGESETAIDSDISDNESTNNVDLDEINTNLSEKNFSDSTCDAARISGCNERVLESGSQKSTTEKSDVNSNSTVNENSVENDKKLDGDDDNSSNDSLLSQRYKLILDEGDESDGSRSSETNRDLDVSEKPTSTLCIDHKKDDLKTCKTEEEQLIEDVQNFYPEIELSKTQSDIIKEGRAYILKQTKNVFYNPVQEFNRDISVAAISVFAEEHRIDPRCQTRGTKRKANDKVIDDIADSSTEPREAGVKYSDGIVILEALSATGLRSIRYAKEVPGVKEIVANDISIAAVESIKKNIEYNGVEDLVTTSHNDASLLMYMRKAQGNFFDVVDLDPYGCPSRFLDSAVQCVRDGGLLLITCTDMAVLAGNSPETCYVKYGAISLRNPACHEMALRITLQCIESHANKYGRYIIPQLSFSADFYIRVIVKVYTSPAMCKRTTSKLSMIYQCVGCQSFYYWPLGLTENCNNSIKYHLPRGPPVSQECPHCGSLYYQGGPIWNGSLHNITFVEKLLFQICEQEFNTEKRMEGMLELIREELVGTVLYYTIDSLCSKVHCEVVPRNKFVSALLHAGYKVTLSHAAPNSIKTNAPSGVIWDIIRCWVKDHPVNPKRLSQGSVAEKLLSTIPRLQANFDLHPEVMPRNKRKLLRYQQNPQPFWGPGTRDKTNSSDEKMSKSYTNQNKKHKRANIEREKARMKAAINSKNIDIIEVVTLTDDDDDNNDVDININDVNTKNESDNIKKNDVSSDNSNKNEKMETESINESESIDVTDSLDDSKINNDRTVEDNNLSTDNDVSDNEHMVSNEDDDNENMVSNENDDNENMVSNKNMVSNQNDNENMVSNENDDNENMVSNENDDNENMVSNENDDNKNNGEPDKESKSCVEGDKTDINND